MQCYVCDQDNWEKLNGLHTKSLMQICKGCGTLCHEVDAERNKKMLDYYRTDYRGVPTHRNLITGSNKIQYVHSFLADWLKDKKNLVVGDVGAATGYLLNYFKGLGHKVTGSEYTINYRRMSEHFYGIPLTEELSKKHKYDLIVIYHVLEHMTEPDKKLLEYKSMLSENGVILVATPYWLDKLENQDGTTFLDGVTRMTPQDGFNHVFHKDHINCFSIQNLQNLFKKVGLTIVKENTVCYGQSYLLKPGAVQEINPEDWQTVRDIVFAQRKALELQLTGRGNEAVKVWPLFPEAHMDLIFKVYGKDPERQQDMLDSLPDAMKLHPRVLGAKGDWLEKYDKLDEAIQAYQQSYQIRPNILLLERIASILARQGKHREAMNVYGQVVMLHPYKWAEVQDNIIWNACKLPTWDEQALKMAKEAIFRQAVESKKVDVEEPELTGK